MHYLDGEVIYKGDHIQTQLKFENGDKTDSIEVILTYPQDTDTIHLNEIQINLGIWSSNDNSVELYGYPNFKSDCIEKYGGEENIIGLVRSELSNCSIILPVLGKSMFILSNMYTNSKYRREMKRNSLPDQTPNHHLSSFKIIRQILTNE